MNVTTESRLLVEINQGNTTAHKDIILGHHRMVYKLAKKHARNQEHKEDLESIGTVALCEAANKFPNQPRPCRFSTFAHQRIEAAMIHNLRTNKGILSASEWEGRTDSRLQRNFTELTQELGREPTLDEFAFVYGEEIHEQPQETSVDMVDAERSVPALNGNNIDFERLPQFARLIVEEVAYGASSNILAEVSQNLSIPESEVQSVLSYAADYIHFS